MDVGVGEFAEARGVSRQRVLALIHSGEISASQVGRTWVINRSELAKQPAIGRPLSPRRAAVLIQALSGVDATVLNAADRFHAKKHMARLREAEHPADLLRSWLKRRQIEVLKLGANPADLSALVADSRLVASGVSDTRSALSSIHEVEGYVQHDHVAGVVSDFLLVGSASANVNLHVVAELPDRPLPLGYTIADLADRRGAREDQQVGMLLRSAVWNH